MLRFDQIIGTATRLRFPTGAFGKTCMLIAIIASSCTGIAWAAPHPLASALALLVVGFVAYTALKRLFDFADKNPSAAILEGAEFVRHEQIQLAAKGLPVIPEADVMAIEEPENIPLPTDPNATTTPDAQDSSNVDGGSGQ